MDDELTIRPARPDDRPAMERIAGHTWDWGDYIPLVWDEWLADEQGVVLMGDLGEETVALSKIAFRAPDEVWLEGMRVDPAFRRRGIASRFLEYSVAYAREHGGRVVRLGTAGDNTAVHLSAAHAGMECIGTYALWAAEPLPGGSLPTFLTPAHAAQVQAFLEHSPLLAHAHGLYSAEWIWEELSAARLARFLEGGQVAARLGPDGTLAALATIHPELDDERLWVGFADGQSQAVTSLVAEIRAQAAQIGSPKVESMVPDVAWLREAFGAAGYSPAGEGELWIYERWLHQDGDGDDG
jgi:GNAT superfamily N-acetyltransferase